MARIRVRIKQTGQTGSVDESQFDPNMFDRLDQQQNDNIGDALNRLTKTSNNDNILTSILKSTAKPFTSGASIIGGGGYELARLGNLVEGTSENPFVSSEQLQKSRSDPFYFLKQGLGAGAGIAAYAVPGAIAGSGVKAGALAGGLSGASPGLTEGQLRPEDIATGAALGGILGKILGGLGNKSQEAGKGLRQSVLKPQAKTSPFYTENINELNKLQSELGLSGSAKRQLGELPYKFRQTDSSIRNIIKDNNVAIPKDAIKSKFYEMIDQTNYLPGDPGYDKVLKLFEGQIDKLGDSPSAMDIYNLKSKLGNEIKPILKKLNVGNPLMPKEEARFSLFQGLKSVLDDVNPQIRELNKIQEGIYNLSEGLVKSANSSTGINLLGNRIPVPGVQTTKDATGRALNATGSLLSNVNPAQASIGMNVLKDALKGNTTPLEPLQQPNDQQQAIDTLNRFVPISKFPDIQRSVKTSQASQQESNRNMITPQMLQMAYLTLPDKDVRRLQAVYDLQSEGKNADQKKAQAKTQTANSILNQIETQVNNLNLASSGVSARLRGLGATGGAMVGTESPEIRAYEGFRQAVAPQLIRALGEVGTLSDADKKAILQGLPTVFDSKEEARQKIANIRSVIEAISNANQ